MNESKVTVYRIDLPSIATLAATSHVMIDLETWSSRPDACIAEFAAVFVDKDFNILHAWDRLIEASPHTYGHFDPATAAWHKDHTNLHKRMRLAGSSVVNIRKLLTDFQSLLFHLNPDTLIWCQGTDFDIPILINAGRAYGIKLKFPNHRNLRDLRTYTQTALQLGWKDNLADVKVNHEALDDCIRQLNRLASITKYFNFLAGGKPSE